MPAEPATAETADAKKSAMEQALAKKLKDDLKAKQDAIAA